MNEILKMIPDWVVSMSLLIYGFNFLIINIIRLCTYYYFGENKKYFIDLLIPFRRIILDLISESKKNKK